MNSYSTQPFIIEVQRWEPLTAISSASLSTVTGMGDATMGIFVDPYKEYKLLQSGGNRDGAHFKPISDDVLTTDRSRSLASSANTATSDLLLEPNVPTRDLDYAKRMGLASAISFGKFLGRSSRGVFIDLPLAATEGMLAVPRLYGEKARVYEPITDWRSGKEVAWSTFTHGVYEGFTDIFVHTYQGKKKQGALGVAKGLTRGLVSLTVKTGAATAGLIAYPNQGIYRSLRASLRQKRSKQVAQATWAETEWLMRTGDTRVNASALCSKYEKLLCSREHGTRDH